VIRKFQNKPIFVKPNKSGSSWGISKVIDYNNELEQAIKNALTFDNEILIEYYIEHREIVMGVIHYNGEILISLPGECGSVGTIYDYNEKYILGNTLWKCPAQINMKQKQKLAFYAKKVFNILCCKDFARVDFFLDKNSDKIILNEVNTIPGFTESSVFPKLLSASGYSIEQLISYWIEANLAAPNCKE
jgi:D-alanine-D-alanine ligase